MLLLKLSLLLVVYVKFSTSTAISHVDKIFEIFSARSLVRFFEFNSGGWNLTEDCAKKLFQYLEGLQGDMLWAIKCKFLVDSFVQKEFFKIIEYKLNIVKKFKI